MNNPEKIGVFGGTFNPVHTGHLLIAENAYDEFGLDKVLIIPAHIPPHKREEHILPDEVRMAMIREAVRDVPYFVPCDYEIRKAGVSYTSDTLNGLSELYPNARFYLIMGADSLMAIENWHHPEDIIKSAHILAAARDDADIKRLRAQAQYLKERYTGAQISVLGVPKMEVSSTIIRERIQKKRTIRYFVPEAVRQYIMANKLYEFNDEGRCETAAMDIIEIQNQLRKKQTERRFQHILGVQYTSTALAMRYGADMRKAELAGLLHDCAKHMTADKLIKICQKNDIEITLAEQKSPYLLHAKAGAYLALTKYGISDEEILDAIRCHTTGKPAMTLLEKIVFVADYIEPSRNQAPNLDKLRKKSFEDIDEAVYLILKQTLGYLNKKKQSIDQQTEVTYNYYRDLIRRNADE